MCEEGSLVLWEASWPRWLEIWLPFQRPLLCRVAIGLLNRCMFHVNQREFHHLTVLTALRGTRFISILLGRKQGFSKSCSEGQQASMTSLALARHIAVRLLRWTSCTGVDGIIQESFVTLTLPTLSILLTFFSAILAPLEHLFERGGIAEDGREFVGQSEALMRHYPGHAH